MTHRGVQGPGYVVTKFCLSTATPMFKFCNDQPFRLVLDNNGRHRFGGPAIHSGIVPPGADVPVQLVLSLDLTDPLVPIDNERGLSQLPLYYPFKYGMGGPEIQYAVRSDTEIEILYISANADDINEQYLQVKDLPQAMFEIVPLTYEQARILGFLSSDGFFQPNRDDLAILDELDLDNLIRVGNRRNLITNAPDIICRNPTCEYHDCRIYFQTIALVPPIPVDGDDDFWYEFQCGVTFCFGFCYHCGTIIAFNVAD